MCVRPSGKILNCHVFGIDTLRFEFGRETLFGIKTLRNLGEIFGDNRASQ